MISFSLPNWFYIGLVCFALGCFVGGHMAKQWTVCRDYHSFWRCAVLTAEYPW